LEPLANKSEKIINWNKAFFLFVSTAVSISAMVYFGMVGWHIFWNESFTEKLHSIAVLFSKNEAIWYSMVVFWLSLIVSFWLVPNQKAIFIDFPLKIHSFLNSKKSKLLKFISLTISPFILVDVAMQRKIQSATQRNQLVYVGDRSNFRWFSILSTYIAMGFLAILSTKYINANFLIVARIIAIQIIVLIIVAAFLVSAIAMIMLFSKPLSKKCEYEIVEGLKVEMKTSICHCEMLSKSISIETKRKLITSLQRCSRYINDLNDINDELLLLSGTQIHCHYQNFDKYFEWVLSPQAETFTNLRTIINNQLEIITSGLLHNLPTVPITYVKIAFSQRIRNILMLLLFTLPIIAVLALVKISDLKIDSNLNGLYISLYILWCLICANLFIDKLNLNIFETIKDISHIFKPR